MSGKQKNSSDLAVGLSAYYNEFDNHAAEWLRNLIAEGLIADGDVDGRPIEEVTPNDLEGYTQCHFFAGIGGWSYALRLAGWSDERPVWTGSCPCQSFSTAGKRQGASDERHLWPDWFRLIEKCQPPTVFGEQVAGAIGFGWLDAVATDFESQDYAFGSAVLSGFTVGAHHKRQRLWFVADSDQSGREAWIANGMGKKSHPSRDAEQSADESAFVADSQYTRSQRRLRGRSNEERQSVNRHAGCDSPVDCQEPKLANTLCERFAGSGGLGESGNPTASQNREKYRTDNVSGECSPPNWEAIEWVECQDGKTRPIPVEPNVQPLVNGIPEVLDREGNPHQYSYSNALKGVGNAIIPEVGAEFIRAYVEVASWKQVSPGRQ